MMNHRAGGPLPPQGGPAPARGRRAAFGRALSRLSRFGLGMTLPLGVALTLGMTLALAGALTPRVAQGQTNMQIQESRRLYAEAIKARAAGDFTGYRENIRQALGIRPYHPELIYRLAGAEAMAGDRAAALRTLERVAGMGLSFRPEADDDFRALAVDTTFVRLVTRFQRNAAPIRRGVEAFRLEDRDFAAEGIAADPRSGEFFLSSVTQRRVIRRTAAGRVMKLQPGLGDTLWSAMGLAADPARNRLWVGSAALKVTPGVDSTAVGQAGLFGFDLKSGRLARRYLVGAGDGPHVFGDITVSATGDVYISDSGTGAIYRLTAAADTLELYIAPGVFASPQGLAFSEDGNRLYIADYSRGIMVVNLASSQVARVIAPEDAALLGIDGLARHDNTLIAVQNGTAPARVLRLRLDGFGTHIIAVEVLDSAHPLMHEPTHGVVVGSDFYYVANSLWDRLDGGPIDPNDPSLVPPVVVKIPLVGVR